MGLIEAVAASGAVAGLWPPIVFNGQHYFDGGFYSITNEDLAVGCERVLVLSLRPGVSPLSVVPTEVTLAALKASGAQIEVVHPDEATEAIIASVGGNVLDPSVREPATRAGREQGRRTAVTKTLLSFWS
jgi:NTE family protein